MIEHLRTIFQIIQQQYPDLQVSAPGNRCFCLVPVGFQDEDGPGKREKEQKMNTYYCCHSCEV